MRICRHPWKRARLYLHSSCAVLLISCFLMAGVPASELFLYYPLYDWQLGFHSVPQSIVFNELMILSSDAHPDVKPMALHEFARQKNLPWLRTVDYKSINRWADAHYDGEEKIADIYKHLIEERWFRPSGSGKIRYELMQFTAEPIEYFKHRAVLKQVPIESGTWTAKAGIQ